MHEYTFVHPFDDPDVIAGQGTIGMEILRQHQHPIHAVFVAIGGGGLISGVAAYIKAVRPEIKVIGVQMADSDAMVRSVRPASAFNSSDVGLFSDGTAVKLVGEETFRMTRALVDDFVVVDTDAVCAGDQGCVRGHAQHPRAGRCDGRRGDQAVRRRCTSSRIRSLVAITCGANMNFDRLRFVAERAEVGEEREALFAVTIPEKRGSFKRLCEIVGDRNVTEFNYRISDENEAHVFVGLATSDRGESAEIAQALRRARLRRGRPGRR